MPAVGVRVADPRPTAGGGLALMGSGTGLQEASGLQNPEGPFRCRASKKVAGGQGKQLTLHLQGPPRQAQAQAETSP